MGVVEMKVLIDGQMYEGTVEEIVEMKHLLEKKKSIIYRHIEHNKKNIEVSHKPKIGRPGISDDDTRYLEVIEYYKKGWPLSKGIKKYFGSVNMPQINRMKKLLKEKGIKYEKRRIKHKSLNKKGEVISTLKRPDIRIARCKFINSRCSYLMKNMNYTREKAYTIASQEWEQHGKQIKLPVKIEPATTFEYDEPPQLLNGDNNNLLLDVIKNVIANHGKITYYNDGKMFGVTNRYEWEMFIKNIMSKSEQICKYFSVPNNFIIQIEGNIIVIKYK